jgi:hypothetical protein
MMKASIRTQVLQVAQLHHSVQRSLVSEALTNLIPHNNTAWLKPQLLVPSQHTAPVQLLLRCLPV